ncbi:DUF4245 family protein [Brachybacterium sp. YJGR34]|uniref:DUF4245 family protein n=1 Tax=Brachybacterium sp. YJGR34 TaxID=2059911 RepID=UPI001E562CF9|nr:DUF4245 family protein [Brachybacterium sp. YJGR34]
MHDAPSENRDAPESAPRPKSAYQLPSKQNTVLRNMLWALVLTLAVVVVVGIAFFGVGSDLEREPLENSAVDVAASAERAQELAPFPVAVPQTAEGWTERSARYTDGGSPRWTVEYTTAQGDHVTLTEESALSAPMLSQALPGGAVEEELSIEGAPCQQLRGAGSGDEQLAIACEGEGWGFVAAGAADPVELEELAAATVTALD